VSRALIIDSLTETFGALAPSGVTGMVYDWSRRPFSPEPGRFELPEVVEAVGAADALMPDWCGEQLYRIDPVQRYAATTTKPFFWSYHPDELTQISSALANTEYAPVTSRLSVWKLRRGMTLPLHLPQGAFATLTAFLDEDLGALEERDFARFTLVAHALHEAFLQHVPRRPGLTKREAECMHLAADGLSSKQIAFELDLSESMVVKHIHSATRRLGARNRIHAAALATRYGFFN